MHSSSLPNPPQQFPVRVRRQLLHARRIVRAPTRVVVSLYLVEPRVHARVERLIARVNALALVVHEAVRTCSRRLPARLIPHLEVHDARAVSQLPEAKAKFEVELNARLSTTAVSLVEHSHLKKYAAIHREWAHVDQRCVHELSTRLVLKVWRNRPASWPRAVLARVRTTLDGAAEPADERQPAVLPSAQEVSDLTEHVSQHGRRRGHVVVLHENDVASGCGTGHPIVRAHLVNISRVEDSRGDAASLRRKKQLVRPRVAVRQAVVVDEYFHLGKSAAESCSERQPARDDVDELRSSEILDDECDGASRFARLIHCAQELSP